MSLPLTILIVAGLFTSRALVDPEPLKVEPSRNPLQLTAAVVSAASTAGWHPELKDSHTVKAVYKRAQHSAEVQIDVAPTSIAITYVSSENLSFSNEGGQKEIHKAYLEWTKVLAAAVKKRLTTLCPDLTPLAGAAHAGTSYAPLAETFSLLSSPSRMKEVRSSAGVQTGYLVREYVAFVPNGRVEDCGPVSAVFYDDKLVTVMRAPLEPSALAAYTDVLSYLVDKRQITFSDAELERMSLKIDTVMPLDPPRRDEVLRFVEWQTQRLAQGAVTKQEYEYLLAQKEADVQERQHSIQAKDEELDLMRQQQMQQRASIDLQRQQLAAQRSLAIGQALTNLTSSMSYRPYLSCTSSTYAGTTRTLCH